MKKRSKFAESKSAFQPSDSDCHTLSPTIDFFTIHTYIRTIVLICRFFFKLRVIQTQIQIYFILTHLQITGTREKIHN